MSYQINGFIYNGYNTPFYTALTSMLLKTCELKLKTIKSYNTKQKNHQEFTKFTHGFMKAFTSFKFIHAYEQTSILML